MANPTRRGTLGILLRAADRGDLSSDEARQLVALLVREHRFRISIEVFQAVQARLDDLD